MYLIIAAPADFLLYLSFKRNLNKMHLEKYNFHEQKEFDVSLIRIDPAVREMCAKNACGQYGKNHMCPPAIKGITEWKKEILSYKNGILLTKVYPLKNKSDFRAMTDGMVDFQKSLAAAREELIKQNPDKKYLFLGAGFCRICKECAMKNGEPCRYPEKAFPSLEACGIDVTSLSKTAGVNYNNGVNTVTYFGAILY